MSEFSASYWRLKGAEKWVCEVRVTQPNGEVKKIQRRGNSKREVTQIATNIHNQFVRTGRSPSKNLKVTELIETFVGHKKHQIRQGTLGNYVHLLSHYVSPRFGERYINSLESREITEWLNELRSRGLRPMTVNTIRARFHDLIQFAVRQKYLADNPLALVPIHKAAYENVSLVCPPWSMDEARKALAAFQGSVLDAFVAFAISTGMRKGEILALRWSDLNFSDKTIRVSKSRGEKRVLDENGRLTVLNIESETKTESSDRTLRMPKIVYLAASRTLEKRPDAQQGDFVVTGVHGGPMSQSMLRKTFERICASNDLRRIRIHDLRHTAAVLALEAGAALEEVSQGLGHSGVEITKRTYASKVQALSDRFVDKLDEAFDSFDEQGESTEN